MSTVPPPSFRSFLLTAVGGSGVVSALGFALRFGAGVLMTRVLGVEEYGLYALAFVYLEAVGVIASLGLNALVARLLPGLVATGEAAATQGLLRLATIVTATVALSVTALGALVTVWVVGGTTPLGQPLVAGILLLTAPGALARLRQGTLQGLTRVVQAQLGENVVRPLVSCLLFGVVFVAWDGDFSATQAMALSFCAAVAGLVTAELTTRRAVRQLVAEKPRYEVASWRKTALPLFGVSVLTFVNARVDLFVLGFLDTTDGVAVFNVVQRVILLMAFVMGVFATAFAPRIGTFHASGDHAGLQRQLTGLARTSFSLAVPVGIVLLVGGEGLLALFGPGFEAGTSALSILVAGQLVNVFCGAVGMVLTMTGNERVALKGMVLVGSLNLVLDVALIPSLGIVGAAVATATSMTAANLAMWWVARRRTGLDTSIIALTLRATTP